MTISERQAAEVARLTRELAEVTAERDEARMANFDRLRANGGDDE